MKQVVERFADTAEKSHYWNDGFGDWAPPSPNGDYKGSFSEGELVNTAFFFRSARIVADVAAILGRREDAERYTRLAEEIRRQFESRHYHADTATYGSGRQVTSVLPLAFGLVDEAKRPAIVAALQRRIEGADNAHVDTGIFGTRYLFEVLIDHDLADLAFKVLTARGYPGYADQIAQGATTTWEQWAFHGKMQTHNHAMFAGPDATFFSRLGGIQSAAPGFREIVIRPAMPAGLSHVECARETMMGRVASEWTKSRDGLVLRVSIPANATARVYVPAPNVDRARERGQPATKAEGVSAARMDGACAVFSVGSGDYEFSVR
jgi:alpha-L-rhamnosidase